MYYYTDDDDRVFAANIAAAEATRDKDRKIAELTEEINRQKAEIERSETNCLSMAQTMPNMAKAERAEAIKEFAERLKEKCRQARYSIKVTSELSESITLVLKESDKLQVIDENDIDNALKELL